MPAARVIAGLVESTIPSCRAPGKVSTRCTTSEPGARQHLLTDHLSGVDFRDSRISGTGPVQPSGVAEMSEVSLGIYFSALLVGLALIASTFVKPIFLPLMLGAGTRLLSAWLIFLRIVTPPSTQADAITFEHMAREWSQKNWHDFFALFNPAQSFVVSWFGGFLYKLVGPSAIMLGVVVAIFGSALIILTYILARHLVSEQRARIAAWIAALTPFAIVYSAVFLREVFGIFGLMLGLIFVVKWLRTSKFSCLILATMSFSFSVLFHGAYLIALAFLILLTAGRVARFILRSTVGVPTNVREVSTGAIGTTIFALLMSFAIASNLAISKIGTVDNALRLGSVLIHERVEARTAKGGSAYPSALIGVNPIEKPWVIPARVTYFLFSPFPWDIQQPEHALGFTATVTFLYLAISIWKSRRLIIENREMLVVFIIVMSLILVFGIAVDNIGTSIRHRTKFMFALSALCAYPVFPYWFKLRSRVRPKLSWPPV